MSVYLDWAATTTPDRDVLSEAAEIAAQGYGNPSSLHAEGKKAAGLLEEARRRCAAALGVKPETLFFTSGGTESDHLPMLSLLQRPVRGSIAISAIEHPAIREQARMLDAAGWKMLTIPVTPEGFVTPKQVLSTIRENTAYVAVMAVNNETGAVQPVKEIAQALNDYCNGRKRPHFHVDAVQATGKVPLDFSQAGIDSIAISGHKLQAPRGIGLLYLNRKTDPFIRGGGQESGFRPGTENLYGAWALSRCLEKKMGTLTESVRQAEKVMSHLVSRITTMDDVSCIPETRQPEDIRFSPWVLQATNTVLPGEVLVRALSDEGVYISTGSACSSHKKNRPVLDAMKVPANQQQNAFRISIGPTTTEDAIDTFITILASALEKY